MSYNSYKIYGDWEIVLHDQVSEWISQLDPIQRETVMYAIKTLSFYGPSLGRPFVDLIKNSNIKNLKELRPFSGNLRLLFVFDPKRQAVILVAGDKSNSWNKWYSKNIKLAEKRYNQYLVEIINNND
jgi:hypothetical protein